MFSTLSLVADVERKLGSSGGVAGIQHGSSIVDCRVSSGRIRVVLFWTKYAVPRQTKFLVNH